MLSPPARLGKKFVFREMGILSALVALMACLSLFAPRFLDEENLFNVLRQFSFIALIAIGETFVIVAGGIDLSVGSIAGLAGVVCCAVIAGGHGVVTGITAGILVGGACGLFNGWFTAYLKLPYFIVTLATMSLARGFMYVLTQGNPIVKLNPSFFVLGQGSVGPVPIPVVIMGLAGGIGYVLLNRTAFGRKVAALGGNEQVALLSGLPISRIKILVLAISGLCSALSGITLASRLNSGQPSLAAGYELDAIAAVVIGGTSLFGGSGSILGTLTGAAVMGVMRNGLVLMNVSAYWQSVAVGAVILLACSVERVLSLYQNTPRKGSNSRLRFVAVVLVAVFAVVIAGYAVHSRGNHSAGPRTFTIAVVPKLIHPYFEMARRGAAEEASKLGVNLIWQAPLTSDPAQQAQIIEDLLTKHVDAIAVAPVDDQVLLPFLARAQKQQVPVLTWDVDTSDKALRIAYVGTDNFAAGQIAGREALRLLAGNPLHTEYAVMTGSLGALNLNQRLKGFENGLGTDGPYERVAMEASDDNADRALGQAEAILKGHPNLSLIFCTTGTGTPQAAKAVREAILSDQVTIIGFDALDDTLQAVRDGSVKFIVAQHPFDMGRLAVRYLNDYLHGRAIPPQTDTGATIITQQNVGSYR